MFNWILTMSDCIKIGSLFSGIGGFELGLEKAIPNSETVWQVEKEPYCQKILNRHWPNARIYSDVCLVGAHNLEPVDIICGGFPCQDISYAGKGRGINAKRSGLWWQMHRIISELRPTVAVLENVPAILRRGGVQVIESLAQIGYDCEWTIVSAKSCGSPHTRERWFAVAYTNHEANTINGKKTKGNRVRKAKEGVVHKAHEERFSKDLHDTGCASLLGTLQPNPSENYWRKHKAPSPVCRVDDGVSNRVDRLKALGNAIVPQCSETIGRYIMQSGILDDIEEYRKIQKEINNIPW